MHARRAHPSPATLARGLYRSLAVHAPPPSLEALAAGERGDHQRHRDEGADGGDLAPQAVALAWYHARVPARGVERVDGVAPLQVRKMTRKLASNRVDSRVSERIESSSVTSLRFANVLLPLVRPTAYGLKPRACAAPLVAANGPR
jgi:hypothetical protein